MGDYPVGQLIANGGLMVGQEYLEATFRSASLIANGGLVVSQEHLERGHLSVGQLIAKGGLMVSQEHLERGHLSVGQFGLEWRSHGKPRAP